MLTSSFTLLDRNNEQSVRHTVKRYATPEAQSAATVVVEMQMTHSSPHIRLAYSVFFHSCMRFIVRSVRRVVQANFLLPNVYHIITVTNGDASVAAGASAAIAAIAIGLSRTNIEHFMWKSRFFH